MFPKHCSVVTQKEVSFPLTDDDIRSNLRGKLVYKKTEFLVLSNNDQLAVVKIIKEKGQELFSPVQDVEVVSLPAETRYIEDPDLEVLSPTAMFEKAEELGAVTLVAKGSFEHISFISNEEPVNLVVYDVTPLEPPKLMDMVKKVLHTGNIKVPVRVIPRITDLREMAKTCTSDNIMFPCNASQLTTDKKTYFLDQAPELPDEELDSMCLLGCDLSLRIFRSIYNREPEFYNTCPKKKIETQEEEGPVLSRCCRVKEGYEASGNIVLVPWGATQREVEDALLYLLHNH